MAPIVTDAPGYQQTQTTRVTDPGSTQNANPPPPPPKSAPEVVAANSNSPVDTQSPHPLRGQFLNTSV